MFLSQTAWSSPELQKSPWRSFFAQRHSVTDDGRAGDRQEEPETRGVPDGGELTWSLHCVHGAERITRTRASKGPLDSTTRRTDTGPSTWGAWATARALSRGAVTRPPEETQCWTWSSQRASLDWDGGPRTRRPRAAVGDRTLASLDHDPDPRHQQDIRGSEVARRRVRLGRARVPGAPLRSSGLRRQPAPDTRGAASPGDQTAQRQSRQPGSGAGGRDPRPATRVRRKRPPAAALDGRPCSECGAFSWSSGPQADQRTRDVR